MMKKCSVHECNLDAYENHDQCILHCPKDDLDFFLIRIHFYGALKNYIAKKTFNKFCHFHNIAFPSPDIQSDQNYMVLLGKLNQIHLDNCDFFTKHFEINNCEVFFQNCTFHNEWTIYDYILYKNIDRVIYKNCTFFKKVETHISERSWLTIYNFSQFDYTCTFNDDVVFYRARFIKSPFNGNQEDYKNNTFKKLLIENCEFITFEMHLSEQDNGEIIFKKCSFESKLKIRSIEEGQYETQQKNKATLKSLNIIDCHVDDNSYIRVGYLNLGDFLLCNLRNPQYSELNIGDCHFHNFIISNFRNLGRFKLFKINVLDEEKGRLFQIDNTSIGETDFQSINLIYFSTVRLFDNIFSNINYTNVQWKELIEVGEFNGNEITEIAKKRDTYRTLKNVAQKNNDKPQSLIFYTKEMQHHKRITIENRCAPKDFKRYFVKDIFCNCKNGWMRNDRLTDILILIFSEKTNNFGLNWWQPVKLLISFSVVFYSLLLFSIDTDTISGLWKHFFEFINPAHSTKFLPKGEWTSLSYFIDFTYRIIEGLLIYQTIIASRKFSRK